MQSIEYEYEKGKKKQNEPEHDRLKNKLGFIFKMINDKDEVASVSYYSERHSEQALDERADENRR